VGAASEVFAAGGELCFRAKKKVAATATRIIAAAEMRIGVEEVDRVGGFCRDDGGVTLAAGAEGSAAGTMAGGKAEGFCSGGVVGGGTLLAGVVLDGTAFD
jgi:hypothetical protein